MDKLNSTFDLVHAWFNVLDSEFKDIILLKKTSYHRADARASLWIHTTFQYKIDTRSDTSKVLTITLEQILPSAKAFYNKVW